MPLGGLFGNSSTSKPLPLPTVTPSKCDKRDRREKDSLEKDCKGLVLKLPKHTVTVEKKLAEGGFAIVYLVSDKHNRLYALKRQFINDDVKQLEACRRECQIVQNSRGHKNIICYSDHLLSQLKSGVNEYMLLTAFYKTSVLQMMNERLASSHCGLSHNEITSIFCDMCEAVAHLHHSQTPVIHRDLKVENILVDDRNRAAPPVYVLCDFGSATTQVMSTETHSFSLVNDEIERYTTLAYRAPEMVDLYQGKSIGPKVDTWALGVVLYKLCYFTLPFGESAMAIQNGAYSFPSTPQFPNSIKAIIKCLLNASIDDRPCIYQCAKLAFDAAGRNCPIYNVFNVPVLTLKSAVEAFESGKSFSMPAAKKISPTASEGRIGEVIDTRVVDATMSTTTSVNPRLRPKPSSSVALPLLTSAPRKEAGSRSAVTTPRKEEPPQPVAVGPDAAAHLGFSDLDAQTDHLSRNPFRSDVQPAEEFVDDSTNADAHVIRSAFKPYTQSNAMTSSTASGKDVEDSTTWNPFLAAPFGEGPSKPSEDVNDEMDRLSIDSRDPFGCAPFELRSTMQHPQEDDREDAPVADESFISQAALLETQQDNDSELDEQRMSARRRYSYEHIDGVGEDASSTDDRGRTDYDSTDDKNDSSQDDEHDSSVQTDVADSDDGGGNLPLLEDDGLEDDYDDLRDCIIAANAQKRSTNPFLNPPRKPFEELESTMNTADYVAERVALPSWQPLDEGAAPATLPRQVTALPPFTMVPEPPKKPPFVNRSMNITTSATVSQAPVTVIQAATALQQPSNPAMPPAGVPKVIVPSVPQTVPSVPQTVPTVPQTVPSMPLHSVATPSQTGILTQASSIQAPAQAASSIQAPPSEVLVSLAQPVPTAIVSRPTYSNSDVFAPRAQQFGPVDVVDGKSRPANVTVSEAPMSMTAASSANNRDTMTTSMLTTGKLAEKMDPLKATITQAIVVDERSSVVAEQRLREPSFVRGPKPVKVKKNKTKERKKCEHQSSSSERETDDSETEFVSASGDRHDRRKKTSRHGTLESPDKTQAKKAAKKAKRAGVSNASFVNTSFQIDDAESPPNQRRPTIVERL